MDTIFDLETEAYEMTALFTQYEEPIIAANDDDYPEYENLYGIPA